MIFQLALGEPCVQSHGDWTHEVSRKMLLITRFMLLTGSGEGFDVIGVFIRNHAKKQWELTTEVGGRFKIRVYADEPTDPK